MIENGPYRLVTPCPNCPFRSDIDQFITPGRVREIEHGLIRGEFHCHKTLDYDHANDDEDPAITDSSAHCAGALILLERLGTPSQMMRIAERFNMYDHRRLDMDAPVYHTFDEMYNAAIQSSTREKIGQARIS